MPAAVRRERPRLTASDDLLAARCAGVDGCRSGWVVATRDDVSLVRSIADVVRATVAMPGAVVAIDMPIGLTDGEPRACERAARRLISPRGSTVFPTPPRACLDAADYTEACAIARAASGQAISKQAWHILPKIREVDDALSVLRAEGHGAACFERIVESHPECSFTMMNGGAVLRESKHTRPGLLARAELIEREFGTIRTRLAGASADDVLDAYAVLWTAERVRRGEHLRLQGDEPTDASGRAQAQTDRFGNVVQIVV